MSTSSTSSTATTTAQSSLNIATAVFTTLNLLSALCIVLGCAWASIRNNARLSREERQAWVRGDVEKGLRIRRTQRPEGRGTFYRWWWNSVRAASVVPLLLGCCVLIQGAVFAGVESQGAQAGQLVPATSCKALAELTWVALWAPPYLVFALAVESALRAVSQVYRARSPVRVLAVLIAVLVLLILTWLPARSLNASSSSSGCNGMLLGHVDLFAPGGVGIVVAIAPLTLFLLIVVWKGLSWRRDLSSPQRAIAGKDIVLLASQTLLWPLTLPYFAARASGATPASIDALSFLAAVGINVSAALVLVLLLALHAHPVSTPVPAPLVVSPPLETSEKQRVHTLEAFAGSHAHSYATRHPRAPAGHKIVDHASRAESYANKPLPSEPLKQAPRPSLNTDRGTLASFHRLGDEINNLMSDLAEGGKRRTFSSKSRSSGTATTTRASLRSFLSYYTYVAPDATNERLLDERTAPSPPPPLPLPLPPMPSSPTPSDFPLPRRTPTPNHGRALGSTSSVGSSPESPRRAGSRSGTPPARPSRAAVPQLDMGRTPQPLARRESEEWGWGTAGGLSPPPSARRFPVRVSRSTASAASSPTAGSQWPNSPSVASMASGGWRSGVGASESVGVARSTCGGGGGDVAVVVPSAPPVPREIAVPVEQRIAARRSEDAESFKEIPRWR